MFKQNEIFFCIRYSTQKSDIGSVVGVVYPKKVIQKKLSTNKWRKKYYPEVLSKNFFIQNIPDLFYLTLYNNIDVKMYATYSKSLYKFSLIK